MKTLVRLAAALLAGVLPAAAAALLASPVAAEPQAEAIADFVAVCPAALLAPETLAALLAERGLAEDVTLPLGNALTHAYATADGARSVSVVEQTFPDARRGYCIVGILDPDNPVDLAAVRLRLEQNSLMGPLSGSILPLGAGTTSGYLKRAGNEPLVSVSLQNARNVVTMTLERWTFDRPETAP